MNPEELKKALDAIEAGDAAAALEILKAMIASAASGGAAPEPEIAAAGAVADPPAPEDETVASIAASRELVRITGTKSPGEAVAALGEMFTRVKALDADRAALDLSERQALVTELILATAETPATAWEGDAAKRQPKARFMSEPIAELRERTKIIKAARPAGFRAPVVTAPAPKLNAATIAACKRLGITAEEFEERKASAVRRHGAVGNE